MITICSTNQHLLVQPNDIAVTKCAKN
uniref:Uncharacterized protein n=1 Tax=Arundo donax TaxID=35708 RepID=A0A0A8YXX9_ARUDO